MLDTKEKRNGTYVSVDSRACLKEKGGRCQEDATRRFAVSLMYRSQSQNKSETIDRQKNREVGVVESVAGGVGGKEEEVVPVGKPFIDSSWTKLGIKSYCDIE